MNDKYLILMVIVGFILMILPIFFLLPNYGPVEFVGVKQSPVIPIIVAFAGLTMLMYSVHRGENNE